jgi:type I restriction enzyme S subunit
MSDDVTLDEFDSTGGKDSDDTEQSELIQGVAWSVIDSVPEKWVVNNIESDIDILSGNNFSSEYFVEEGGIPLIRIRDLAEGETTVNFDGEYDSRYLVNQNDLLVGMDGEFEPHLWAGRQALLNQRVCKIEPKTEYNKIFFRYAIEKPLFYIQKSIAGTTVKHLSQSNINDLNLPTPPLSEQRKIATVLHTVDQAIQKTEELIAQVQRIRNGIRQDLFAYGIAESGHIRSDDQCQETYLGKIAKDWELKQVKGVCEEVVDCPHSTPEYAEDGIIVVRTSEIENGQFDPTESPRVSKEGYKERISRLKPQAGDVIFTREAPIGEAFKIPEGMKLCLGQRLMQLRTKDGVIDPDFFVELIYSDMMQNWFERSARGSTSTHINVGDMETLKIPIPSFEEQQRIDSVLGTYRKQLEAEQTYLNRLERLKQGLMQDLLSGEVRTTDVDIDIPEEVAKYG